MTISFVVWNSSIVSSNESRSSVNPLDPRAKLSSSTLRVRPNVRGVNARSSLVLVDDVGFFPSLPPMVTNGSNRFFVDVVCFRSSRCCIRAMMIDLLLVIGLKSVSRFVSRVLQ